VESVNETTGALTVGLDISKGLLEKHHFLRGFLSLERNLNLSDSV